jgi:uncharacterized protein YndB with AHSA1/START domain
MKTLHFQTSIEAPASIIWDILWDEASYPKWTAPFSEGSYAVSDWKEGSPVSFLGPDGGGIQSIIEKLNPRRLMLFRHIGMLKDGKPYEDESHKEWAGAHEKYQLSEVDGQTLLDVDVDTTEQFSEYLSAKFPLAVEIVKKLAEETVSLQAGN